MNTEPNAVWTPNPLCQWVTVQNAANQGFPRWEVKSLEYRDANTSPPSDEAANIYIVTLDENGKPLQGVWVWQKWKDGEADKKTDVNGKCDFFMSGDSSFEPDHQQVGPYSIYLRDQSYPTVTAIGFGLPLKRHVQYILTFQKAIQGTPIIPPVVPPIVPPHETLEDNVKQVASTLNVMALNTDAALYKYAQAHGLGQAQTDEHHFTWDGREYILQVFNLAYVYCPVSNVNQVSVLYKPNL